MKFGMWDTLFNLFLMLFWMEIWCSDRASRSRNLMLAPVVQIQKTALDFLQPVLSILPRRMIAALALVFLLAFRGLAVPHNVNWSVSLGFASTWSDGTRMSACLIMSLLSFVVFLFKLWCISLIYTRTQQASSFNDSTDALYRLSRPFVDIPVNFRPLALLAVGILLAGLFTAIGVSPLEVGSRTNPPDLAMFFRLVIVSLSGWVAVLPVIQNCLLLVIIGSFVSLFTGSHGLTAFCREWIDLLIGPLKRYPIRIGMLDLTPLVFMFALGFIHAFLYGILARSFQMLS